MHLELTRKIGNDDRTFAKFLRDTRKYSGIDSVLGPDLIALLPDDPPVAQNPGKKSPRRRTSSSQCGCSGAKTLCQSETLRGMGRTMLLCR